MRCRMDLHRRAAQTGWSATAVLGRGRPLIALSIELVSIRRFDGCCERRERGSHCCEAAPSLSAARALPTASLHLCPPLALQDPAVRRIKLHTMIAASTFATAPAAVPGAARRPQRAVRGTAPRVCAQASAASLADSTLQSDHWSGGSPLILPNGTVSSPGVADTAARPLGSACLCFMAPGMATWQLPCVPFAEPMLALVCCSACPVWPVG